MIGYITIGTNDLVRAGDYYDKLLSLLGASRIMVMEDFIVWSNGDPQSPNFSIHIPENGKSASIGNGSMIALTAKSPQHVAQVHAKALALGSEDCGQPGPRHGDSGFYAAYFRDLDGNKLNIHYMPKAE